MDKDVAPQSQRQSQIDFHKAQTARHYPALWERMLSEWSAASPQDAAWLIYSAGYLLRTGGVRWAIDPLRLQHRLPEAPSIETAGSDLSRLSFVLLTHRHADHLDLDLIRCLRHAPIQWVVPAELLPQVLEQAGLPADRVIVARPLEPLCLHGLTLLPFSGAHWELPALPGEPPHGVPSLGYLVAWSGQRWLFPGDTRTYDPALLPDFGPVDGLFAHVWLGRAAALLDRPPLLDAFCRFCLALRSHRLVLAHLHEFGRDALDYWDDNHAAQVIARLHTLAPHLPVRAARLGDRVPLSP